MTIVLSSETGTMTQVVQSCSWEAQAYQRALELKDLGGQWDRGRSKVPTREAINGALIYISRAAELNLPILGEPFVAALSSGGVQLEWDQGERHLAIELLPDGAARYLVAKSGEIEDGLLGTPSSPDLKFLFGWLAAGR